MKKLGLIALLLALTLTTWGYDFAVDTPNGQKLYYTMLTDSTVEMVHPNSSNTAELSWSGFTKPSGKLTVPSTITVDGSTFSVVSIGKYAFYKCTDITRITVSEGIKTIETGAFRFCSKVDSLFLPSTLNYIGTACMGDLTNLKAVVIEAAEAPDIYGVPFFESPIDGCTLIVPCGSESNYTDDPWTGFSEVISLGCSVVITAVANDTALGTVSGGGIYPKGDTLTLTATPAFGAYFARWSDNAEDNPRQLVAKTDLTLTALFLKKQIDTLYVPVHDTTVIHDTVYVTVTVHDSTVALDTVTLIVPVHDTILLHDTLTIVETMHDTIMPTFFSLTVESDNSKLGLGVGTGLFPAGAEVELCGLPLEGGRFVGWSDGSLDNPRRIKVLGKQTYTALFEQVTITNAEATPWSVSTIGLNIYVSAATGLPVRLYDLQGRQLLATISSGSTLRIEAPAAGAYLVQVGDGAARRVIVH